MHHFLILSIGAAISWAVVSCGPAPSAVTSPSPSEVLQSPGLQRSFELAEEAEVTCADSASCPQNVGMLISAGEDGVARCTGSLIGPDLVLTASRCVPASQLSCAERVRFLLPATSVRGATLPSVQVRCASVLDTGPIHAIIRLESPVMGRTPLKLDFTGVKDNSRLKVAVISPTSDRKPFGELRVITCSARQRTVAYPSFRADQSPVVSLQGCEVGESGAGAPALSGVGAVRAVLGESLSAQASREIQIRYSEMLGDLPVTELVEGANLSCIPFPVGTGLERDALPADCTEATVSGAPSVMQSARAELERRVLRWQAERGLEFGFRLPALSSALVQELQPLPSCLAQGQKWLGAYRHWYRRGGYDSDAKVAIQVPRYRVSFVMNSSFQLQYVIKELGPNTMTLRFSPRQIAREKLGLVSWDTGSGVLGVCPR